MDKKDTQRLAADEAADESPEGEPDEAMPEEAGAAADWS